MCGIAGFIGLDGQPVRRARSKLAAMSHLIAHRGPDGEGRWFAEGETAGLAHRRLAIIDLTPSGAQPMHAESGHVIVYNGEIYNFSELKAELSSSWTFKTHSDTEVLLAAWLTWGEACLTRLRGMFAFAIYDPYEKRLYCARDRFGIKPFYYAVVDGVFYFASEIKALMPVLPEISTNRKGFSEYITFQYSLTEHTLFDGVKQLMPGHLLTLNDGKLHDKSYWTLKYSDRSGYSKAWWASNLRDIINDSIDLHLRSDVPVGSYLSGGVDSGLVTLLAMQNEQGAAQAFHGKFTQYPGYDESGYAHIVAQKGGCRLHEIDITAEDFRESIGKVIYHLDQPVAGPGSFPQYMVSKLASNHLKVVLGGQGGDEIFGGYARYLVGYVEALLKASVMGNSMDFGPGWSEIAPHMSTLREYVPLIKQTFATGLFDSFDTRYLRIADRSADMSGEIDWGYMDVDHAHSAFLNIFNDAEAIEGEQPFNRMLHLDFKCLLPALLQVEDRMSMAHGLESRVPFLDNEVVDFVASAPVDVKFDQGRLKQMLRNSFDDVLPEAIFNRRDKMGFPVPLKEWWANDLKDYVHDLFGSAKARSRPYLNADKVVRSFAEAGTFSRKTWGLLSLELWHQQFHDQADSYRALLNRTDI